MDFIDNGGFGASPIRSSVWCSPAEGFFFAGKKPFEKNILFHVFFLIV